MRTRVTSADDWPTRLEPNDPDEFWYNWLSKNEPTPELLREQLLILNNRKQQDDVIGIIQAALVNDQSQPWMYDVLALSLQIAERPQAEVQRAVLSGVDLSGVSVESLMMSAAYLRRFDHSEAALRLYRQASKLSPTRPEPYVMALRLAGQLHHAESLRWAATGVLTQAWTPDHPLLHKEAESALLNLEQKQREEQDDAVAADETRAILNRALQRDLILKLTWNGVADLDLVVEEPAGTVCSFDNPQTEGGGVLVHDGYGPAQANCYEQYVCASAVPGTYRVRVQHAWGEVVGKRAKLTVIRYQGTPRESRRTLTIPLTAEDNVIRLQVKNGRREELSRIDRRPSPRMVPRRRSLLQMVGHLDSDARKAGNQFQVNRVQHQPGFRPVITVLSEGVTMSALAVVSGDRRYVRITTVPAFTNITDVFTFTTQGGPLGTANQNPGQGVNNNP